MKTTSENSSEKMRSNRRPKTSYLRDKNRIFEEERERRDDKARSFMIEKNEDTKLTEFKTVSFPLNSLTALKK